MKKALSIISFLFICISLIYNLSVDKNKKDTLRVFEEKNINYLSSVFYQNQSTSTIGGLIDSNLLNSNFYRVSRVVDGDTIEVDKSGEKFKVRLIGVNTPETVDPRKEVECFGKEASYFLKNLILDKKINLESDESQGDKDKYGRLLRYVYLEGVLINKKIILDGYGYEYTYKTPYKFQSEFKESQNLAMGEKRGLWGQFCNN